MSDNDFFSYKVPDEIMSKIPEYFWAAFAGELVSIFSTTFFDKDEDGLSGMDYSTSTSGWTCAFKETCNKLNLVWLYDYYKRLPWYESDMFDGEMADMIQLKFVKPAGKSDTSNEYYRWLLNKKKE